MIEIDVDSREVRNAAKELRSSISDFRTKLRKFDEIENDIEISWKSRYTRLYIECLEETERNLKKIATDIEHTANALYGIADSVERAEREIQQIVIGGGGGGGSW